MQKCRKCKVKCTEPYLDNSVDWNLGVDDDFNVILCKKCDKKVRAIIWKFLRK